ncbi:hypothetical protein BpHYR1_003304 [Brachionus plicatilis]|uniref:Uncharacterized protein n=1 Tax=Brachionus plicatilis TaxID=10195 RepID=A0A3M7SUX8_BRAPC|nr:hypothetical protein BpHYR1_003304 [Brachionus plicatilis]
MFKEIKKLEFLHKDNRTSKLDSSLKITLDKSLTVQLINFRELPERLRSETEPVSEYRFLVEETHFGDTTNSLLNKKILNDIRKKEESSNYTMELGTRCILIRNLCYILPPV